MTIAVPYPGDTRAKGWRFVIDYERVHQSDTWALASPEMRPWLLMLWVTAWTQMPCGSLPNNDALIASRIGMPKELFAEHREELMRGWWLAEDGRLYQNTIVERVWEMLDYKNKEKNRKAEWRRIQLEKEALEENFQNVPRDRRGTDTGQTWDGHGTDVGLTRPSTVSDDTGTGTGTRTITIKTLKATSPPTPQGGAVSRTEKTRREAAPSAVTLPDWLPAASWEALVGHRKVTKVPMTEQAQRLAIEKLAELRAQGSDPQSVINQSILNGWKGLFPLRDSANHTPQRRSIHDDRAATIAILTGRDHRSRNVTHIFDVNASEVLSAGVG